MKKLIFFIPIFLLFSCKETKCDVQKDIDSLKMERASLQSEVQNAINQKATLTTQLSTLNQDVNVKKAISEGKRPIYILEVNLRQVSYSLSIRKQFRDAVNSTDFELPVDQDFYSSLNIGDDIQDNFRVGSLIFKGSFGSWRIKVNGKRIEYK